MTEQQRKKLNWHKDNIEEAEMRIEEFIRHKNFDRDALEVYAILKGIAWAVGYLLDEVKRADDKDKDKQRDV